VGRDPAALLICRAKAPICRMVNKLQIYVSLAFADPCRFNAVDSF